MKRQFELVDLEAREKQLNKGDKVKFIDGSSLTSKEYPNESIHIVFDLFGKLSNKLKELECTVVETNLENLYCEGYGCIYKQDILVEVEGYHFYTSSNMVVIV